MHQTYTVETIHEQDGADSGLCQQAFLPKRSGRLAAVLAFCSIVIVDLNAYHVASTVPVRSIVTSTHAQLDGRYIPAEARRLAVTQCMPTPKRTSVSTGRSRKGTLRGGAGTKPHGTANCLATQKQHIVLLEWYSDRLLMDWSQDKVLKAVGTDARSR